MNNDDSQINHHSNLQKSIIKELKATQKNLKIIFFTNLIFFLIFLTITILRILQITEQIDLEKLKLNDSSFDLIFPVIFIDLFWFIYIIWMWVKFNQEYKLHFNDAEQIDVRRIPNFIISKYKNLTTWTIFFNWLTIISIIVGASSLAWMIIFQKTTKFIFFGYEIQVTDADGSNTSSSIIGLSVYLAIIIVFSLGLNIYVSFKKNYLNNLFDLQQRLDYQTLNSYKKKVNFICAILFLLPLIIIYFIYRFINKSRKK